MSEHHVELPTRILVVDDAEDIRLVLQEWLVFSGYAVQTAPGVTEALELARNHTFDVVITDLIMPGLSGHHMLSMIKELDQTIEVIILTGQGTIDDAIEALREGRAFDFLRKPVRAPHQLNATIERAMARRRTGLAQVTKAGPEVPLSPRECEILQLIAQGRENREIAEHLFLSEKTIKNNLSLLYEKLGVANRTQAAMHFQRYRSG